MMPSSQNRAKANKVINLGELSNALSSKGRLDENKSLVTYSFRLDQRSNLQTKLSKIGKEANLDLELWSATGKIAQSKKKKSQNKLIDADSLEAGTYWIKVRRKEGASKYSLNLTAIAVPDPITPAPSPSPSPVTPSPSPAPTPDPVVTRAQSDIFQMGGAPDGSSTYFQIDFSKQDEDPRPNFGLFRGALLSATVAGSATNPDVVPWASQVGDGSTKTFSANPLILFNNTNGGASYRAGDLISFKNAEGKTEFRGILFSPDKYVLCLGFVTTPDDNTLPNSLTSLKAAMTLNGGVYPVRFIGSQSDAQDFLSGRKTLESLEVQKLGNPSNKGNLQYFVSFGEASYTMRSDQQDYTSLGLNPSGYPDRGASDSFSFSIYGNDLNNTITITGNKSSKLYGGGGNDTLYGGDGNDELYGGAGNDRLYGSDGADTLNGYSNQRSSTVVNDVSQIDTLTGGSGSDTFVLGEGNTPYYVGAKDSYAIITDWQPGIDRLQIASVPGGQYIAESRNVISDARLDTEIYYINGNIRDRVAILQDIQDNNPFAGHQ